MSLLTKLLVFLKLKKPDIEKEIKETVEEITDIVEKTKETRERARNKFGRFIAVDPNTPENEAYKE